MSVQIEIVVDWQSQINSVSFPPCPFLSTCLQVEVEQFLFSNVKLPNVCSSNLRVHFSLMDSFTCPCSCMREPGLLVPSCPPHPFYFGMPVPGICSNSSHPVGIAMPPHNPPRPSLIFTACLCLSYVRQHMYAAASLDSPQPASASQPTHFTGYSHN